MPIPPEYRDRIMSAIWERIPRPPRCLLCANATWHFEWPANVPTQWVMGDLHTMHCIAMVCAHCGNIHLLHSGVLGLADLIPPQPALEHE